MYGLRDVLKTLHVGYIISELLVSSVDSLITGAEISKTPPLPSRQANFLFSLYMQVDIHLNYHPNPEVSSFAWQMNKSHQILSSQRVL
jgi:hypothetical protein